MMLNWLKQPIQNTVRHILKMLIIPSDYSLEFVDEIEGEGTSFVDYAVNLGMEKPKLGDGID